MRAGASVYIYSLSSKNRQISVILKVLVFGNPLDTDYELNIYNVFRRVHGHLKAYAHSIYILCPGSRGEGKFLMFLQYFHNWLQVKIFFFEYIAHVKDQQLLQVIVNVKKNACYNFRCAC